MGSHVPNERTVNTSSKGAVAHSSAGGTWNRVSVVDTVGSTGVNAAGRNGPLIVPVGAGGCVRTAAHRNAVARGQGWRVAATVTVKTWGRPASGVDEARGRAHVLMARIVPQGRLAVTGSAVEVKDADGKVSRATGRGQGGVANRHGMAMRTVPPSRAALVAVVRDGRRIKEWLRQ
jgi:hypothetical protein